MLNHRSSKVWQHRAEYVAARVGLTLLNVCPERLAFAVAHGAADLVFALAHGRRGIACNNLRHAGLASSPAAARRLARASFRHLADVALESVLCARRLGPANWRQAVELDIPETTRHLMDDPEQGMIGVTGHLGNWEVGGHLMSYLVPVTAIARRMNNPLIQPLLDHHSARSRMTIISKRQAHPRQMVQAIREGRTLAILMDQHARDHAVYVPFFGRPAATHATPARLHRLTGAPIVFLYTLRTGPFRYRIVSSPPLVYPRQPSNPDAERQAILADLTIRLETAIRQTPEQYLWAHRRWR